MRKLIVFAIVLASVGLAHANCGNGNGNGNGCSDNGGTVGPQGPQGLPGQPGNPGQDGKDGQSIKGDPGANGKDGASGKDGKDATASFHGTMLVGDFAIRLYDGKRVQLQAFDVYQFGSHPGDDVFGQGLNQMIGARVILKLGPSYEETRINEQQKEIESLRRALSAR